MALFAIKLNNCGKSFNRKWLFRNLNTALESGKSYAILGPNGSGKSTFSLMLAGQLLPTEGQVSWTFDQENISLNQVHQYSALASPAMELPEELNVYELFAFHKKGKPLYEGANIDLLSSLSGWQKDTLSKPIGIFSSGMKQRLKLALAFFSNTPVLILDEPLTNLDNQGLEFYRELLKRFSRNRLILVASNRLDEYDFCSDSIRIAD